MEAAVVQTVKEPLCGIGGEKPGRPQCAVEPADMFHRKPRVSVSGEARPLKGER